MPLTFPSHQAVVLPLKLWRPRWFDGVALCAGSAAPDVAYAFDGFGVTVDGHRPLGVLLWGLPVALVLAWLLRRAAPAVAAHLPAGGPLHLDDYAVLRHNPHRWWVTASSALVGAVSHVLVDAAEKPTGLLSQWALSILLIAGAIAGAVHIGRRRLIRAWHGPAARRHRRPGLFWATSALVTAALLALVPVLPGDRGPGVWGVRVICAVALGLLAAAAAVTAASRASAPASRSPARRRDRYSPRSGR
jgi:hypothetical protein